MRASKLGARGSEISVIGYGAWEAGGTAWGPNESEDVVIDAIRAGLDAGIDWIDTAEVYGDGVSEILVGRAISGRRDEVVVATKVAPQPEGSGFSPVQVREACEKSLGRLGIDRIDLYQLHWPDETGVPLEDTWRAMGDLQDAGLVRHIGVSNLDRGQIETCLAIRHVDSLQPEFSMLVRENAELIRWCGEQGIGVITYGPLAFGLLTGAITADTRFPPGDWRGEKQTEGPFADLARSLEVVDRLRPVAERLGCTLSQLALAWNVHQSGVTAAIAGSRNPEHVRGNAAAGDIELDEATLAELDALLS
ncbi:MAG TPA: aldo/keto reductase [Actinomycetota bacterium]|nr:aldo/keto reductase [Actinomycetota bacterium]